MDLFEKFFLLQSATFCYKHIMATKRIGVTLDIKDYKKLKRIARFQNRSLDREGGVAIQAHLQKLNPEAK